MYCREYKEKRKMYYCGEGPPDKGPRVLRNIKKYCIDYPSTAATYGIIVLAIYTRMIARDIKEKYKES